MTMQVSSPASIVLPSVKLANTTLAAPAATIDFSNIDQSYSSLQLILTGRTDTVVGTGHVNLQLNGDAGANYDYQIFLALNASSSVTPFSGVASPNVGQLGDKGISVNDRGQLALFIPHYTETVFYKTMEATSTYVCSTVSAQSHKFNVLKWRNTAAISRITLIAASGNFDIGTIADLYGIH